MFWTLIRLQIIASKYGFYTLLGLPNYRQIPTCLLRVKWDYFRYRHLGPSNSRASLHRASYYSNFLEMMGSPKTIKSKRRRETKHIGITCNTSSSHLTIRSFMLFNPCILSYTTRTLCQATPTHLPISPMSSITSHFMSNIPLPIIISSPKPSAVHNLFVIQNL